MTEPTAVAAAEADRRFLADFETMSAFGATERGGVDRQAGSAPDVEQRRWMQQLLESHGLRVEYDHIGNQFGLLETLPGAPFVLGRLTHGLTADRGQVRRRLRRARSSPCRVSPSRTTG